MFCAMSLKKSYHTCSFPVKLPNIYGGNGIICLALVRFFLIQLKSTFGVTFMDSKAINLIYGGMLDGVL